MLVLIRNFMDASATHMERPIGAYAMQVFCHFGNYLRMAEGYLRMEGIQL